MPEARENGRRKVREEVARLRAGPSVCRAVLAVEEGSPGRAGRIPPYLWVA